METKNELIEIIWIEELKTGNLLRFAGGITNVPEGFEVCKKLCNHVFEAVPKKTNHFYIDFKAKCNKCGYSTGEKPLNAVEQQQKQAKEQ